MSAPVLAVGAPPRVDLMPRAETERRERNALLKRWIRILIIAVVVVVAAVVGAFAINMSSQVRLALENARTQTLLIEIAGMQETRTMQDLEKGLTTYRQDAMATDAGWSGAIEKVLAAIPEGVIMTGLDLTVGNAPTAEDDPAALAGITGTFSFSSGTPLPIVSLSRTIDKLDGVLVADATELTSDGAADVRTYHYVITTEFDQSVFTGRFAEKEDAK